MKKIIKIIHRYNWLLILLLIFSHLFIISKFISRHNQAVKRNEETRHAMQMLSIRANQFMSPIDFKAGFPEPLKHSFFNLPLLIVLFEILMNGLIIFYFWSKNRFIAPLENFKLSAERVARDLNADLCVESSSALVQETADAMHKMQRRIQDLINSRTQLLAAISHDLRTPITRLKLRAQFLTDAEHAKKIMEDLDEIDLMISEILSFARHDMAAEKSIKFDLKALLLSVCYSFIDRGYPIEMKLCYANMPFFGRSIALKRTFINIIENAIKYAGHAQVALSQADESIIIIIEDTGPGVPEAELEKVFQPYYRAATSQRSPGTGLGLTIAYDVIHSHNGTVSLKNRTEGGLHVKIILPSIREEVCY